MNDPSNPLGWHVWQRGAKLGLLWALAFFVATAAIYLLLGVTGWDGIIRALCAMAIGPVLAIGGILLWVIARRPALAPADGDDHDGSAGGEERNTTA